MAEYEPGLDLEALFNHIRENVKGGAYSIRPDAARHSSEEGFKIAHILEALENATMLEIYPLDRRCLLCGRFSWTETTKDFLHIVIGYRDPNSIDVITAYIPKRPWWSDPFNRGAK